MNEHQPEKPAPLSTPSHLSDNQGSPVAPDVTAEAASVVERPATEDRAAWRAWWRSRHQNWRIEPEIPPQRQAVLAERRAVPPEVRSSVYPFAGMPLTHADIEWLLATHDNGRGPAS